MARCAHGVVSARRRARVCSAGWSRTGCGTRRSCWAGGLSAEELAHVTVPMDGGFENLSPASGPFDWMFGRRNGAEAHVQALPDGKGHALRVEFQGQRSEFRDVRQLLLLPEGRGYRLEWRSRFDDLETARGLRWSLTCADGPAVRLLRTEPEAGTRPWRSSSVALTCLRVAPHSAGPRTRRAHCRGNPCARDSMVRRRSRPLAGSFLGFRPRIWYILQGPGLCASEMERRA